MYGVALPVSHKDGRERNGRLKAISCTGDLHEWVEFIWWH
ncbi:hypothetical protein PoMZ_13533 [Pyricularia oryzae]|uniref:Uncharacterized protein n=1 Tax=Pyricularia oryzae TaxID=318829 RepID=A0A4P7NVJ3_PYROR|nr:hypothetical protein PoMZ_13533 [Pyricularia oryzae]